MKGSFKIAKSWSGVYVVYFHAKDGRDIREVFRSIHSEECEAFVKSRLGGE